MSSPAIRPAASPEDWDLARVLFREYERDVDAAVCFAGFEQELAGLERLLAPPEGRLLLAFLDGEAAGCGALRRIADGVAEGRRLYLRPAFRGKGLGGALLLALLEEARRLGFRTFRLETLPGKMSEALALYRRVGFVEIPPYVRQPTAGAVYMELPLAGR